MGQSQVGNSWFMSFILLLRINVFSLLSFVCLTPLSIIGWWWLLFLCWFFGKGKQMNCECYSCLVFFFSHVFCLIHLVFVHYQRTSRQRSSGKPPPSPSKTCSAALGRHSNKPTFPIPWLFIHCMYMCRVSIPLQYEREPKKSSSGGLETAEGLPGGH